MVVSSKNACAKLASSETSVATLVSEYVEIT